MNLDEMLEMVVEIRVGNHFADACTAAAFDRAGAHKQAQWVRDHDLNCALYLISLEAEIG